MDAVSEQQEQRVARTVNHQGCSCISRVASGLEARHRAGPVILVELEAKAVLVIGELGVEIVKNKVNSFMAQNLLASVGPVVEDHLAEDRCVGNRRE